MKLNYVKFSSTEIEITGATEIVTGELIIPSEIDGFEVVSIGDEAFNNNKIESLVIPETVKRIGVRSFRNNQLKTLVLPESITYVGRLSFSLNNLESVTLPSSLTYIDSKVFIDNCIKTVNIPESVFFIGFKAFDEYTKLTFDNKRILMIDGSPYEVSVELIVDGVPFEAIMFNVGSKAKIVKHGSTYKIEIAVHECGCL